MNEAPEVFRFAVIRSPEAVTGEPAADLPTLEDLGGPVKAKALAEKAERRFLADADGEPVMEGVLGQEDPHHVLASLLRYGNNAKLLNRLARHLREQRISADDSENHSRLPLVIRARKPGRRGPSTDGTLPELERKPHFGPVGVGDLMIVEQHLLRYEPGEIAHIENVMKAEERSREHRLLKEREVVISEEQEQSVFMEQDLQTAERFELQSSAADEISQRSQLEAGVNVSASYGPTVEVESSLDYSRENARQASRERSSSFAQEITEHAVKRTEEKIVRKREERVRSETEHTNTHKFVNTGPESEHTSGVYRYVDKVYKMKLVNRGVRFFYEFIVPTPGAFLRELGRKPTPTRLKEPGKPRERVTGITASNYPGIISKYKLGNIGPPPAGSVVLTEAFSNRDSGDSGPQRFMQEGALNVPAGYMADSARVSIIAWSQHRTNPIMELVVGNKEMSFPGSVGPRRGDEITRDRPGDSVRLENLGNQRESIGYQFFAQHDATVQVKLEVKCVVTPEAVREWQHKVYDAIIDDYRARLSEYHAALQEESNEAAITLDTEPHPLVLRRREQNELKRLCLQLLGQEADLADPLNEGGLAFVMENDEAPLEEGKALIDIDKLSPLSREIRFAEQAFEWVNMTYTLYPYYWADEGDWDDMLGLQHDDHQHGEFLRAGAARVLVPIREHFHKKVHAFLVHGPKALEFADSIDISSPLWLPLYREIEEVQNPSSQNLKVEKCWDTRVPTNLILLQADAELPEFQVPDDCPDE